jgi:hypothetical protein
MDKIVVSNETFYDEERELFYTYVGTKPPERTLLVTAWGKDKIQSQGLALVIKDFLTKYAEK